MKLNNTCLTLGVSSLFLISTALSPTVAHAAETAPNTAQTAAAISSIGSEGIAEEFLPFSSSSEYLTPSSNPEDLQHLTTSPVNAPVIDTTVPTVIKTEIASNSRFNVQAVLDAAYSEVGQSFATGWSAPGECIMAVKRWLAAGGVTETGSGTPLNNYIGAERITGLKNVQAGDVVQYIYASSPHSWASGVHTVLITGNNDDGTFKIVESNNPGGSGLVSSNDRWTPTPPEGFEAHFYRF